MTPSKPRKSGDKSFPEGTKDPTEAASPSLEPDCLDQSGSEITPLGLPTPADSPRRIASDEEHKDRITKVLLRLFIINFILSWGVIVFQIAGTIAKLPILDAVMFGTIMAASSITTASQIVLKYYFQPKKEKSRKSRKTGK